MQKYQDFLKLESLTKEKYCKNVISTKQTDGSDDCVNKDLTPNELSTRYTLSVEIKSLMNEKKNLQRELVELSRQLDNVRLLAENVSNNIKRLDELKKRKEEKMAKNANSFDEIKTSILSELTCSICYELIFNPITLSCYHTFCLNCIDKWLRQTSKCPVCRIEFRSGNGCMMLRSIIDILLEQILNENEMAERKKLIENRKDEPYRSLTIIPNFISNNLNLFQIFSRIYNEETEENLMRDLYTDSRSEAELDNDVVYIYEDLGSNNQQNENNVNISRQSVNQNSSSSPSLFQQVSIVLPMLNSTPNQRQEALDNVRNLNNQRISRVNSNNPGTRIRRNNTHMNINSRIHPYNLRPRNQN